MNFNFFESFYEAAQNLSPKVRHAFYDALLDYFFRGVMPDKSNPAYGIFVAVKPNIDNSRSRKESGARGGRKGGLADGACKARIGNQNAKQNAKQTQSNIPSETQSKRKADTMENAKQTQSKTQTEKEKEKEKEYIPRSVPVAPSSPRTKTRTKTETADILDRQVSDDEVFAPESDAVSLAVRVTGDSQMLSRRFWRRCANADDAAFREELFRFRRELAAGEIPDNPGAAFTERVKRLAAGGAA